MDYYTDLIRKVKQCHDMEAKLWTYLSDDKHAYLIQHHSELQYLVTDICKDIFAIDAPHVFFSGLSDVEVRNFKLLLHELKKLLLNQEKELLLEEKPKEDILNGDKNGHHLSETSQKITNISEIILNFAKKIEELSNGATDEYVAVLHVGKVELLKSRDQISFYKSCENLISKKYTRHLRVNEFYTVFNDARSKNHPMYYNLCLNGCHEWISMAIGVNEDTKKVYFLRDPPANIESIPIPNIINGIEIIDERINGLTINSANFSDWEKHNPIKIFNWNEVSHLPPSLKNVLIPFNYQSIRIPEGNHWYPVFVMINENGDLNLNAISNASRYSRGVL